MESQRRSNLTTFALYAVAALLLANLLALLFRSENPAMAQRQGPIAGGAGMFVMPAQLSGNTWGCYLMDVDRGTLCVYQFYPGSKQLQFVGARNFINDVKLKNYNTTPSPAEIADLVNKQDQAVRGGVPILPPPDEQPRKDNP
jgi:hypothetical protein